MDRILLLAMSFACLVLLPSWEPSASAQDKNSNDGNWNLMLEYQRKFFEEWLTVHKRFLLADRARNAVAREDALNDAKKVARSWLSKANEQFKRNGVKDWVGIVIVSRD